MRIGVAGKGGAGKTTVSATMARLFARRGYDVNALDGDP
ncbi:MAG: P-loop NTPase, partial [Chloroflexi bacterium]|nr:P-loop NTPase [Chloroflexota bacterium]